MSAHSWFAASAASRWMACGASAVINTDDLPEEEKPAAERGTMLHDVSERILKGELNAPPSDLSPADVEAAMQYVDFVRNKDGVKFYELHSMFVDDCGGTSDAVILHPCGTVLEICDAKFGRVYVSPKENKQLMLYALGVAKILETLDYNLSEVVLTIAQPACDNFSSWSLSMEDLLEWGKKFEEQVSKIKNGDAEFNPIAEACQWCDGRTICPAYAGYGLVSAREQFGDIAGESETEREEELKAISSVLDIHPTEWTWIQKVVVADLAIGWGKMIHATVEQMVLKDGDSIDGFKQVRGRQGNRKWDGNESKKQLVQFLIDEGFGEQEIYTDPQLISPATADNLFKGRGSGEKKRTLAEFTTRAAGRVMAVPESDRRPAIDPITEAKEQFAEEGDANEK